MGTARLVSVPARGYRAGRGGGWGPTLVLALAVGLGVTTARARGTGMDVVPFPRNDPPTIGGLLTGAVGETRGASADEQGVHAVLVDRYLRDSTLLARAASPGGRVFLYDSAHESAADVLSRVVTWAERDGVEVASLSIVSHGAPGAFALGYQWVTTTSAALTAGAWRELSGVLAPRAGINLFGCSVGAPGGNGQRLIDELARLTGADVFASDNVTGRGGDWELEVSSPGTEHHIAASRPPPLNVALLESSNVSLAWYNPGWRYRKQITIDHTRVSGGADLTDFPVLVNLGSDANLAANAQSNGDDILFTSADGATKLSHEIEAYTSATGALTAWVRVPSVSASVDTVLYVYYGNSGASAQQDPTAVWDTDYHGVWHLNENATFARDSTSYANNATSGTLPTQTAGQIGNGLAFDGSTQTVGIPDAPSLNIPTNGTFSVWFKLDAVRQADLFEKGGNGGYTAWQYNTDLWWGPQYGTLAQWSVALGLATGEWYRLDGVSQSGIQKLYLNGTLAAESSEARDFLNPGTLQLGSGLDGMLDGSLDEFRISDVVRSDAWIQTEYNNQSSPVTFLAMGAEQGLSVIGTGTDPGHVSLAPGGAATLADAFTFQTAGGIEAITAVTVNLAAGTSAGLSLVEITNDAGTVVHGSVSDPASDTPTIPLTTSITATTTVTQCKVRVTPKSHAAMPAPAGSTYSVTAFISNWAGANEHAGSDSGGTTVTIDNLSPGNVTGSTAAPGNTQVSLSWTSPGDADLESIVVLRHATSAVGDTPAEGVTYVVGDTIGASTVACVVTAPAASCTDTGLTNGTAYHYKIFAKDTNGNCATGVVPTGSPSTPVNDPPVLTAIEGAALSYTENAAATAVTGSLTVSDVDSANLTGATVSISVNYANGQDVLAFTNQLGITGSWSAASGVLTLTGTTTVASYQTALRAVTYANSSDSPSTATRTVAFVANDGAANSNTVTRNITVTAVNDPPTISDVADQTTPEGTATGALAFTVGDAETSAESLTVTATSSNQALVPDANLHLGGSGAARTVTAIPAANQGGTATITITVSDGSSTATDAFVLRVVGIRVTPALGLTTTEAGGTATFTVVLMSQPMADVTIGVASSDLTEGTVAPPFLTFTSATWHEAQTVTVTGVNDAVVDGAVGYTVVTAVATSADPAYHGLDPSDVAVSNADNDTAGISVTPTSGLVTTEAGGTAIFTVVLTSEPTAPVTIDLVSSDTTEGTPAPATLTFTSGTWHLPQTVTVTGVDDAVVDANVSYTIVTAPAVSADATYQGVDASDVSVSNTDDDTTQLTVTSVTPATGPITGGTTVVIVGSGFAAGATVTFGTAAATSITFDDASRLTVVTPAGSVGTVDVTVVNPDLEQTTLTNAFTYPSDYDVDGLPDTWEVSYFGDLAQAGADDPDRDTLTNLEEHDAGTDPTESVRYFAEGANGEGLGFETRIALMNPHELPTSVTLEFLTLDGREIAHGPLNLAPHQRLTVDTWTEVPGLASASFSTIVRSALGVVADRTMHWDGTGYASHAETAILAPNTTWYLAEGATHSGFRLYYLLQNPNATAATVQVSYLLTGRSPITVTCTIPPRTRKNINANVELCPGNQFVGVPPIPDRLVGDDVSTVFRVTNGVPIIVERAMYQGAGFSAGTATAGVNRPATEWFLAEGATGGLFDTYVLLANPSDTTATFQLDLLRLSVTPSLMSLTQIDDPWFCAPRTSPCALTVPPRERRTIRLDAIPGMENDGVSSVVRVTNGVGVLVERAMWWPGSYATWTEGHASFGTTATGTRWGLADGEVGGARNESTYVLVANTSTFGASVRATLVFEDGTTADTEIAVPASSRANFNLTPATIADYPEFAPLFPPAVLAAGKRFGVIIDSLPTPNGTAQIVVERAQYGSDGRAPSFLPYWPAGTNAVGTRLAR